jgi:hypothetical protein
VVLSDQQGIIRPTDLWPQAGINDPFSGGDPTVEEAVERWQGKRIAIELRDRGKRMARREITLAPFSRPLLVSTDVAGRLRNGFEAGTSEAIASGFNVPFRGAARVYMVPRQHDWQPGNAFAPVRLASGREASSDVDVDDNGRFQARIARARELSPGAYDFIVRPLRYGYEDDEDFTLRASDVVTRTVTGLVVRMEFMASKAVRGGCVNMLQIAGRTIQGQPYFQYADVFQIGDDVYGALDPLALDPSLISQMVGLYVVAHKTAAQWSADPSLAHLAVLGGNAAVQKFAVQSGCINYNKRLLWPAASIAGEYDVIADFGNDDTLTPPVDIIDGYFVTGFRVVPDPATDTQFTHAGTFE